MFFSYGLTSDMERGKILHSKLLYYSKNIDSMSHPVSGEEGRLCFLAKV